MIGSITRRTRAIFWWMAIAAVVAALGYLLEQHGGESIVGAARGIDGDSLFVRDIEIRVYGIDAPELHQNCQRDGRSWACGQEAARTLRTMIANREVSCRARERDRYGRTVAVCHAGGLDLGAAMIRGGYAVAFGGAYRSDEREAREARRGIWGSQFDPPSVWRQRNPRRDR